MLPHPVTANVILTPFLPLKVFKAHLGAGAVTVVRTGIGAAAVERTVALLARTACRTIVFVGSCAGAPGSAIGSLVAVERARRQHGGTVAAPSGILFRELTGYLHDRRIPFLAGNLLTVDEPCADYPADLSGGERWHIDMETAALYAAAEAEGLPAAALLYISDIPGEKPFTARHNSEDRQAVARARDRAVAAAAGFVRQRT